VEEGSDGGSSSGGEDSRRGKNKPKKAQKGRKRGEAQKKRKRGEGGGSSGQKERSGGKTKNGAGGAKRVGVVDWYKKHLRETQGDMTRGTPGNPFVWKLPPHTAVIAGNWLKEQGFSIEGLPPEGEIEEEMRR
jgi:hypothetical protein